MDLKQLRGNVVLVNFWATWCPPCRKEMPDLEKLHQRFGTQGLIILAISDEDTEKVKPYIVVSARSIGRANPSFASPPAVSFTAASISALL